MEEAYDSPDSPMKKEEEKKEDSDSYYDSDGSEDEYGGVTIKGASQYLSYQPREKKQDRNKNVNEEKYFKNIQRLSPKLDKY